MFLTNHKETPGKTQGNPKESPRKTQGTFQEKRRLNKKYNNENNYFSKILKKAKTNIKSCKREDKEKRNRLFVNPFGNSS